jgi:hypothetical protein
MRKQAYLEDFSLDDDEPEFDYEYFVDDTKMLARYHIDTYFKDKQYYCGGQIPKSLLQLERYITIVLNRDIHNSIDAIYSAIGEDSNLNEDELDRKGTVPNDVRRLITLLNMMAHAGIPREFHVGMVIMHLEICEGLTIKL